MRNTAPLFCDVLLKRKMKKTSVYQAYIFRTIGMIAIIAGVYANLQFPLMKISTPMAVSAIEDKFVRTDLEGDELSLYDFHKNWILSNARELKQCNTTLRQLAAIGLPLMGILLLISTKTKKQNQ
jgi:hypothetical protein